MTTDHLAISDGVPGLVALLQRAASINPMSVARVVATDRTRNPADTPQPLDVFVTTPFQVLVSRRVTGTISRDGAVCAVAQLADKLGDTGADGSVRMDLDSCDASWPGAVPRPAVWQEIDTLPASVVADLSQQGKNLARQFSGPMGPPASLMDQNVLTVTGNGQTTAIPMRMIFALTNFGLIPGNGAAVSIPRHIRVATAGSWQRIDAAFGSAYRTSAPGVLSLLT
ncbi:hypothetical protein ACFSSC_02510 [Corynebacterium mendelii]|uniref:Uncharacterized protein n=1 Tax=Corynebacterium mendelii TaxID=2765362 RepID=A0A939IXZ5_9CORY|nr:hypothetical protein [Corynebacterium mendelii]MBN9644152.1 hypothetical protein [Corynebacterium mendelii]